MGARPLPLDPLGGGRLWRAPRYGAGDRTGGGKVPVQGLQQVPEGARVTRGDLVQQASTETRMALVLGLAAELGEAQQPERGARCAGGDWGVLEVLAPCDQSFAIGAVEKKPPRSGSAKRAISLARRAAWPAHTSAPRRWPRTARSWPRAEGIVLEIGADLGLAVRCRCAAAGPDSSRISAAGTLRSRWPHRGSAALAERRAASASAQTISAFQLVRRLSSSPGRTRPSRAASSVVRMRSRTAQSGPRAAVREHVEAGLGMVRGRRSCPARSPPSQAIAASASSPSSSRSSRARHT